MDSIIACTDNVEWMVRLEIIQERSSTSIDSRDGKTKWHSTGLKLRRLGNRKSDKLFNRGKNNIFFSFLTPLSCSSLPFDDDDTDMSSFPIICSSFSHLDMLSLINCGRFRTSCIAGKIYVNPLHLCISNSLMLDNTTWMWHY